MTRHLYLVFVLLAAIVLLSSCVTSRTEAFLEAAGRIESQIALEWGGVVDLVGVSPHQDLSFMEWEGGRDYIRWRLLNIERYAELGQRMRAPSGVSEQWVRHWNAGLSAFTSQGAFAFKGLHENDITLVMKALDLCEAGWSELAQREQSTVPAPIETFR